MQSKSAHLMINIANHGADILTIFNLYFVSIVYSLSATLFHYKNPAYWSNYTVFSSGGLLDFAFESAQKVSDCILFYM